jgi:predicted PurR-regulated permease PerM
MAPFLRRADHVAPPAHASRVLSAPRASTMNAMPSEAADDAPPPALAPGKLTRRAETRFGFPAVPPAWQRALCLPLIILAWLAVFLIAVWILGHFTKTLLMIALAGVLAFAFTPLAGFLTRWLPRAVALGLAYLLGVGAVLGFGALIVATTASQVLSLVASLPEYARRAQSYQADQDALLLRFGIAAGGAGDIQQQAIAQLQAAGTLVASQSLGLLASFFGGVVDFVLVLILSIYLAANGPKIVHWLRRETPRGQQYHAQQLVVMVNRVIGGYVRGVLVLALLIGALVGLGMAVLGVPYAVLLGVLAFFMEFIPVLGVFISGAASVAIALVHFHEPVRVLLVLVYFVVVHIIEGDVVGPRIMGNAVGIHPATGLVALVAGTELFGVWGALLAAPIAGLLQAIVTVAWLEFRDGRSEDMLKTVAERGSEPVERKVGVS